VKRFAIVFVAALIGIAAPARAWCEASCFAAPHHSESTAKPHCPAHESPDGSSSVSAGNLDDCPLVEAARPTTAHIVFVRSTPLIAAILAPLHSGTQAPRHPGTQTPRHLIRVPLRI